MKDQGTIPTILKPDKNIPQRKSSASVLPNLYDSGKRHNNRSHKRNAILKIIYFGLTCYCIDKNIHRCECGLQLVLQGISQVKPG